MRIRFSTNEPVKELNSAVIPGLRWVANRLVGQYLQIVAAMYGMAVRPSVERPIRLEMWYGKEDSAKQLRLDAPIGMDMASGTTEATLYIVRRA